MKVSIDTPYYKGEVLALCVEKPLVGLIIGNIPGAREQTWGNCNSNCNVIVMNYIFKVMESNL